MNDNMQILSYIYIRELNNTPHTNIMIYIRERPHTHYLHTDTENQNSFANVLPYTHILTPHHTHTLCTFFKSPFSVLTIHTPFSLSLSLFHLFSNASILPLSSPHHIYVRIVPRSHSSAWVLYDLVLYFFKRADDSRLSFAPLSNSSTVYGQD